MLLAACSTTKHLPEGEVLYTGQKSTIFLNPGKTSVGETAMVEVEAALYKAPNNSIFGIRYPFPLGLWVYNSFQKYEKGPGKWIFDKFAAAPVLLSTVNPDIRRKAAANLLRDYGYFNGKVSYKTFVNPKDSLKVKLQYTVDMRNPYFIDTVCYRGFSQRSTRDQPGRAVQCCRFGRRAYPHQYFAAQCGLLLLPSGLPDIPGRYDNGARRTCADAHDTGARHAQGS